MSEVSELFRAHAGFVERILRRAGVPERDLGDATQEVFVVVHRRLHEFEGRACVTTWLYRIARNVASELRRRAFRRYEVLGEGGGSEGHDVPQSGCTPDSAELLQRRDELHALLEAIDRLDADKREALVRHELEERPMREVAAALGVPLKTAFSRVYAARRQLLAELRKSGFAASAWWALSPRRVSARPLLRASVPAATAPTALCAGAPWCALAAVLFVAPGAAPVAPTTLGATIAERSSLPLMASEQQLVVPTSLGAAAADEAAPESRPAPGRRRAATRAPGRTTAAVPTRDEHSAVALASQPEVYDWLMFHSSELEPHSFTESPLAARPFVAPERHPRARLVLRTTR